MLNIKEFLGLGYYTSQLDEFLAAFDAAHPKPSASQRKEIKKHERVYRLRDNVQQPGAKQDFWGDF